MIFCKVFDIFLILNYICNSKNVTYFFKNCYYNLNQNQLLNFKILNTIFELKYLKNIINLLQNLKISITIQKILNC